MGITIITLAVIFGHIYNMLEFYVMSVRLKM